MAHVTADPCCAPEQQTTCCEPSANADCCGHGDGCGCDASTPDIRETVRGRYAAAAVQITTTDPGAGCGEPRDI